jgi:hypothetical protein
MSLVFNLFSFLVGVAVGGAACAISAKAFGWFQKQVASVEKKV